MPALENGQRIERYRIVRYLGNGVSGESYEAEDTILQRKVTLKLIQPWKPLPETARRQFFREMHSISLLNHPYLAAILDYGEIDDRLYVVRHYTSHGSLLGSEGRLWFKPPLDLPDAIQYTYQLAQALHYMHSYSCLHGGITLSNILIQRTSNADHELNFAPFLLADVGLSDFVRRFGQPQIQLWPITAAPEQLNTRAVVASDQFALAVLLYFWLAGRPPYLGSPKEIEQLKLSETITPLSELNPNVTLEQEDILYRALAAHPEDRYPSILTFVDALVTSLVSPSHSATSNAEIYVDHQPSPEPLPQPAPEPLPQPAPEPLPQPAPEPLPLPTTEPTPQPTPEPLPEPAPEPLPQPTPDVYQPLDPSAPEPTSPQTDVSPGQTSDEPQEIIISTEQEPAKHQETLEEIPVTSAITARLIISFTAAEQPCEFELAQNEIWLGRAGSDDILLNQDTSTSRHHALLKRVDNRYTIYDQRSTNGVFVNGQKLANELGFTLTDNDCITIGNYKLVFRCSIPEHTLQKELA
ncbi:MAG: protein kinase domain-containing protein [Ktedonobacteraceae bacterium]